MSAAAAGEWLSVYRAISWVKTRSAGDNQKLPQAQQFIDMAAD